MDARRKGQISENGRPVAQARKSSILNKKLKGKHRCQEEAPDPGKCPPRRPALELTILNKKLIGKHRCQEEGPDPGKLPPRRPGPEIVDS
jgi:hypothetical protein